MRKVSSWPGILLPADGAAGYGTDPDLIAPKPAPWPGLLTRSALGTLAAFAEALCPGAGRAGVTEVINEWISAPYPDHVADRSIVAAGLSELGDFASESPARQQQTVVRLCGLADNPASTSESAQAIRRIRILVAGAYYSSPQGAAELGYVGNQPIAGSYPGPSREASDHLAALLKELDL